MWALFIFVIALVIETGSLSATRPTNSGCNINQELALKLETLEHTLAMVQESQQSVLEEMEAKLEKRDKETQDLRLFVEMLQTKLESNSEESGSLKVQLLKFFSTVSSANKFQRKQKTAEKNLTTVEDEAKKQSEASNTGDVTNNEYAENVNASIPAGLYHDDEGDIKRITTMLEISSTGGVSYTRWGRTTCEGDADVLYTGYATGKYKSSNNNQFPGSEIICLHGTPEWGDVVPTYRGMAPVAGVHYAFSDDDPFSKKNLGGQPLHHHDVPCTVCHVVTRSHQLMIPGRKSCPSGWTLEYWGYLAISPSYLHGGEYQCVDQAPEGVPGGAVATTNSQYVRTVEINCYAALPCPPYIHGYEISCVVCTK